MSLDKYRILSFEAKDIILETNNNGSDIGVLLPKEKDDKYFQKFKNALDMSLDCLELLNFYPKHMNASFSFKDKYNNKYTLAIIHVNFSLNLKNENHKVIYNTTELRKQLYNDGFYLNGKHYVRYKRSSGSSRKGSCLFILENLKSHMYKWSCCGLKQPNTNLASWEAYIALSLSSIKGTIEIPLDNILFVEDHKNIFKEDVITVKYENDVLESKSEETEITNNIWDGESLLDESLFTDDFKDKHMLLIRNKFFKSCAFKTKIQKWFKDNNITSIKQLNGLTIAKDISQIKMITTPSSLKYLKFAKADKDGKSFTLQNIQSWSNNITPTFGVVKYDKRTKYFQGEMVQSCYQFLNTIHLDEDDTKKLLQPNIDFLKLLHDDNDFVMYYCKYLLAKEKDESEQEINDGLQSRGLQLFDLLNINSDIKRTRLFRDFKTDLLNNIKNSFKTGNLLLKGNNATLFGNGPELLKAAIGTFINEESVLKENEIYCENFINNSSLLCARYPHITMGNLYLTKNNISSPIWQYFDLGNNIVCVNAINNNIQQRLNGCDYDSDSMLITDNPLLIDKVNKHFYEFKVPVCAIEETGIAALDLYEIDAQTSNNKIGDIVNLSQRLNSLLWEQYNQGCKLDDLKKIYCDICKLSILSGIEIDKAKHDYPINSNKILTKLTNKYKNDLKEYPLFFKSIYALTKEKFNKITSKKKGKIYRKYLTTMDNIYTMLPTLCDFSKLRGKNNPPIKLSSLFKTDIKKPDRTDYNHKDKILDILTDYYKEIKSQRKEIRLCDSDEKKELLYEKLQNLKDERNQKLTEWITSVSVLKLVITELEKAKPTLDWEYISPLLEVKKEYLNDLFISNKSNIKIKKNKNGKIKAYHLTYSKITEK